MKNKIFTAFIVITIFLAGTAWIYGMVKAEREVKVVTWPITETSEVKPWQQDLMSERALQLDNQEPDLIWDTEDSLDWTALGITDANLVFTGDIDWQIDLVECYDIVFRLDNVEIKFKMTDGKFDVIYDPNECTAAANTFFVCMNPHLQSMILEKAKELAAK